MVDGRKGEESGRKRGHSRFPLSLADRPQLIIPFSTDTSLHGRRILLYSYGGGFESGMYSIRFNLAQPTVNGVNGHSSHEDHDPSPRELFKQMTSVAKDALARLDARERCSPERYTQAMQLREEMVKQGGGSSSKGASRGESTSFSSVHSEGPFPLDGQRSRCCDDAEWGRQSQCPERGRRPLLGDVLPDAAQFALPPHLRAAAVRGGRERVLWAVNVNGICTAIVEGRGR